MSMYSVEDLLARWTREEVSVEQVVGQLLQLIGQLERRVREVERRPAEPPPSPKAERRPTG